MGHTEIVDYLVKNASANVMHADTDGWTALHNAASKGFVLTLDCLRLTPDTLILLNV